MLMQPEALAHQPSRPVARDRVADLLASHHPQPGRQAAGARKDIGNEAATNQALALRAGAREFALLLQAPGAREAQGGGRVAGHGGLDGGKPFAAHAAAIGQNGATALLGIAIQKAVLASAPDFRRLILAFHVFL
jgi:hypothetical protein